MTNVKYPNWKAQQAKIKEETRAIRALIKRKKLDKAMLKDIPIRRIKRKEFNATPFITPPKEGG